MYTIIGEDQVKARQTAVAEGYRKSQAIVRAWTRDSHHEHRGLRLAAFRAPGRFRPRPVD